MLVYVTVYKAKRRFHIAAIESIRSKRTYPNNFRLKFFCFHFLAPQYRELVITGRFRNIGGNRPAPGIMNSAVKLSVIYRTRAGA